MRTTFLIAVLLCALPLMAGEMVIDLQLVFHDEIVKKYGTDWANWIIEYPTHPPVDVSGKEPCIHNGLTATWRHFDPRRAEWACLFRINADGQIVGRYLYDNRLKPMPVNEDSVIILLKKDSEKQKK